MPNTMKERRDSHDAGAPVPGDMFDLIVIGAGINGAGIARDAAARGLRVALVEREDIGSGTSNYSGRLVHGGLRYLEQGDVRLVRESLRERERLCVEVALAAYADGAKIYTYAEVDGLLEDGGTVRGVRYKDRLTGETHQLGGRIVVNAAGPWVDAVLASGARIDQRFIGGTKGSHLVVDPFPGAPEDVVY